MVLVKLSEFARLAEEATPPGWTLCHVERLELPETMAWTAVWLTGHDGPFAYWATSLDRRVPDEGAAVVLGEDVERGRRSVERMAKEWPRERRETAPIIPTPSPIDAALGHVVKVDGKANVLELDTGELVEVDSAVGFRVGMQVSRGEAR